MTPGDAILFTVVILLGFNHLANRIPEWVTRPYLFWPLQLINLAAATFMMASGIPEFQEWGHVVNWILGLLFVTHIIQNNRKLLKAKKNQNSMTDEQAQSKRAQIVAALQAGQKTNEKAATEVTADSAEQD